MHSIDIERELAHQRELAKLPECRERGYGRVLEHLRIIVFGPNGLTDIAQQVGISQTFVRALEYGIVDPSVWTADLKANLIEALSPAGWCQMTVAQLVDGALGHAVGIQVPVLLESPREIAVAA